MLVKSSETKGTQTQAPRGGDGVIVGSDYVDSSNRPAGSLFREISVMSLEPESSIGYHIHEDDEELYSIISGRGIYSDNGTEVEVSAGDVTVVPKGTGHGLKNIGAGPLVFFSVICE